MFPKFFSKNQSKKPAPQEQPKKGDPKKGDELANWAKAHLKKLKGK